MPIPALTSEGILPPGVHECMLEEVGARFGRFQGNDRRPTLFWRLESLVDAVRRSGFFCAVVVDGSFVSDKLRAEDIDVVLVLKPGHDFLAEVTPAQYSLLQARIVRRQFGLDSVVAEDKTEDYSTAVEFFQRVKERPDAKKGVLRINI